MDSPATHGSRALVAHLNKLDSIRAKAQSSGDPAILALTAEGWAAKHAFYCEDVARTVRVHVAVNMVAKLKAAKCAKERIQLYYGIGHLGSLGIGAAPTLRGALDECSDTREKIILARTICRVDRTFDVGKLPLAAWMREEPHLTSSLIISARQAQLPRAVVSELDAQLRETPHEPEIIGAAFLLMGNESVAIDRVRHAFASGMVTPMLQVLEELGPAAKPLAPALDSVPDSSDLFELGYAKILKSWLLAL